jgi:two-component sensor histidine kinase
VILTDDARMLINLRYPPGVELPEIRDPGSLRKAWTTQKAEVGDLRNGRASFRVPVVRQAETKYTIVAAIEPELFNAALASSRLPDEWTGLLVDSDGILAGRSTDAAGPTGSSVADKIALLGKPDEQGIFRTVEAGETYIAGARVGATRWHVLVEVPTALVKRQVIETRFAVWSAAGAAAIFALVLTGLLLRQWATRREVVRLAETNVALTRAVAEKDILLAEVYHRVKNNLQLVEALMALHSADFSDQKSREAWQAIRRRISALGLVHQQLLHSDDLAHFDLRPFLADLCGNIERAFAPEERDVRIVVDVESIAVDLDFAIPLGLLVNEFVSNAFKHAFPPASDGRRPRGEIRVRVDRPAEDRVRLVIADNGVGGWTKDEPGSAPQQPSVGLQISQSLVAQLRGTLAIRGDEGTTIELVMPAPTARKQKVGADAARKG